MSFSEMIRDPKQYIVSEETRENIAANIAIIESRNTELVEMLDIASGALADIAHGEDMTLTVAKNKASRIYKELQAIATYKGNNNG